MPLNRPSLIWQIVGFSGLVILVIAVAMIWRNYKNVLAGSQNQTAYMESHDIGSQMIAYTKQGRYDDAVQAGLRALRNHPSDDFIYQQIANVYLVRAQIDIGQREQWVDKASSYAEKALSVHSKDQDPAGVQLFQIARTFEVAGGLSTTKRCADYERATKLLEDRVPLLQGDQLTLDGKAFPLAPLRNENEKTLAQVTAKTASAGCK